MSEGSSVITVETENGLTDTCDIVVSYLTEFTIDLNSSYGNQDNPFIMKDEPGADADDIFLTLTSDKDLDFSKFSITSDKPGLIVDGNKVSVDSEEAIPGLYNLNIELIGSGLTQIHNFTLLENKGKIDLYSINDKAFPSYNDNSYIIPHEIMCGNPPSWSSIPPERLYIKKSDSIENYTIDEANLNSSFMYAYIGTKEEFINKNININVRIMVLLDNNEYRYLQGNFQFADNVYADIAVHCNRDGSKLENPLIIKEGDEINLGLKYASSSFGNEGMYKPLNANYTDGVVPLVSRDSEDAVFNIRIPDMDDIKVNEDSLYYHEITLSIPEDIQDGVYENLVLSPSYDKVFPNTLLFNLIRPPREDGSILDVEDDITNLWIQNVLNISVQRLNNGVMSIDIWESGDDSDYAKELDKHHFNIEWDE